MNLCDDLWYDILTCDASLDNATFLRDTITSPLGQARDFYGLVKSTLDRNMDRLGVWLLSFYIEDRYPDVRQQQVDIGQLWDRAIPNDDPEMARALRELVPKKFRRGILLCWNVEFADLFKHSAHRLLDCVMSLGHKPFWLPEEHIERIFEDRDVFRVITKHYVPSTKDLFRMLERGYYWVGRTGHLATEDFDKLVKIYQRDPPTRATLGDILFVKQKFGQSPKWFRRQRPEWAKILNERNPLVQIYKDLPVTDLPDPI